MNKIFLIATMLLYCVLLMAQVPQAMNYQAVVRDVQGNAVSEKAVSVKFSLLKGSTSGTVVYEEVHKITTAKNGVVNLQIGKGTVVTGAFENIDWSLPPYFICFSLDVAGGTSYKEMGTSQMLSVPYALYAEKAGNSSLSHQFIVTPYDGPTASLLSGSGKEMSYFSIAAFVTYLDMDNQEIEYKIEGLPSGLSIDDYNTSAYSVYGRNINLSLRFNGNSLQAGSYSCTLVFENKYGVTRRYPFIYKIEATPSESISPEDKPTSEELAEIKKNLLSSYSEFVKLNAAIDNAFMKRSSVDETLYSEFEDKTYTPSSSNVFNLWSAAYKVIRKANAIPKYEDNNEFIEVIDQARAVRAYAYLMLTQWFGDVPLVLETIDEARNIGRTPKEEVLSAVISDLRKASIKTKSSLTKSEMADITNEEMKIMLREAYLLKGEWQNAIDLGDGEFNVISSQLKNATIVDFIKKVAGWKLNKMEGITESSLINEYLNSFYTTYNRGNLYLNALSYSATYFSIDSYKVQLPIPQRELELNSKMVQNFGY